MGELSKLLGTDDIMKDLSSTTEKPTAGSILAATGAKSVAPNKETHSQIKKGALTIHLATCSKIVVCVCEIVLFLLTKVL